MSTYLLETALSNTRSRPVITCLMVLAIALGIGFLMTIVTVGYSMSNNPFPEKSHVLYAVQLDAGDPDNVPEDPDQVSVQVTYVDAMNLMQARKARRQFASARTYVIVVPDGSDIRPFQASGRGTFTDFFAMFEPPFKYGAAWSHQADTNAEQVVVLSNATNDRLFGGEDSVGRTVNFGDDSYLVVGVLDSWWPIPRVYDMTSGAFDSVQDVFIPFNTMVAKQYGRRGNVSCWKPLPSSDFQGFLASECVWIQFWVELADSMEKAEYMDFLDAYAEEQKSLGRFGRPINNHLRDIEEWLEYNQVVDETVVVLIVIAGLFLGVCLINALALMLAKFLARSKETAIRRALGASRLSVFTQLLLESGFVGLLGGLAGIPMAWFGLKGLQVLFGDEDVVYLTTLDTNLLALALAIAVGSTLVTGIYPALRGCRVHASEQLKL